MLRCDRDQVTSLHGRSSVEIPADLSFISTNHRPASPRRREGDQLFYQNAFRSNRQDHRSINARYCLSIHLSLSRATTTRQPRLRLPGSPSKQRSHTEPFKSGHRDVLPCVSDRNPKCLPCERLLIFRDGGVYCHYMSYAGFEISITWFEAENRVARRIPGVKTWVLLLPNRAL